MTDSQNQMQPIPTTADGRSTKSKGIQGLILVLVIGAILVLIVMIYNSLFPEGYFKASELGQNQAKWESKHITHYRFVVDLPLYDNTTGRTPLTVEVKGDTAISVVDAKGATISPNDQADIAYDYSYALTVPRLFSYVNKQYLEKPPKIDVTYDPVPGCPASIYVDPYIEPCCQDFTITVRDFETLT